ncbi:DUF6252 family protein [Flavobacterium xanthum]|uniref:Lipoprotein n=1 Tax=Flavobacterium xanthum TaxID=69322 RepID=A0A1M7IWJ6_9FLAO|nr:DUF6252 family protein [Flavobacterium xanthum]SHM45111.1 hypothetical protein SAMN05443669_103719 [Flavobacterium xanthum]
MKNILLLLVVLTLSCCSKDDNKPENPIDQLPPATQIGANTAGCLVDGKAFLPNGYIPSGNLVCNYINGKDFSLGILQKNDNQTLSLNVISYNKSLVVGETYQLKEYGANSIFGEYVIFQQIGNLTYQTNSIVKGELKITNHNFDKAVLSGVFWFDAVNEKGEKVQVREGRFDMQY